MAVEIIDTKYKNLYDATDVNWLLANIGDDIIIEHTLQIREYVISSTDNPWVFNNTNGYLVTGSTVWVTGGDFSKFNVGDTLNYTETSGGSNYTNIAIVEKLSNTEIRLGTNPAGWAPNTAGTTNVLSISNPITYLQYQWNFVGDLESTNFVSKIDNVAIQIAEIQSISASSGLSNQAMTMLGTPEYKIGSVVVDSTSLVLHPAYTSTFKIKHTTKITPMMLASQWDDIYAGIKPSYFLSTACLRPIFYVEARYLSTDPNRIQFKLSDETLGNTGYLDEKFNQGITNYSISNLIYKDSVSLAVLPKIKLTKPSAIPRTTFEFNINNTTNAPFVAGTTKLTLNFLKCPNDESEYQFNGRNLITNFVWETKLLTCQTTPTAVNGDNYANPLIRSLSNLKATFVSASVIKVTGTFDFTNQSKAIFEESLEPRYLFTVAIQDHTKTGANSDRVNLKVDIAPFYYLNDFPLCFSFATKLIPHDCPDYVTSFIDRQKFSEDELVAFNSFVVDYDAYIKEIDSIVINRITHRIKAYNTSTGQEFILESKNITVPTNVFVGQFQQFNLTQPKNIRVPSTEIRKNIITRNKSGVPNTYECAYPFLIRWEYWDAVTGVNSFFYDITKPNNGFNNEWVNYYNAPNNWTLRYEFEIGAKVNGIPSIFKNTQNFDAHNRNLIGENTTAVIDTFDATTLTPLTSGGLKYILGYKNTLIRATFTNTINNFNPPGADDYVVVIGIEVFEEGGVIGKRRMSSKYVSDADTFFIPLAGETKVKITGTTTTLIAETELDFTTISSLLSKNKWKITARSYSNFLAPSFGTINYARNYLKTQDVYLIANNPINEITQVLPEKETDCCSDFVWRVLADTGSSDELRNDKNTFLYFLNKDAFSTATIKLIKPDATEVTLSGASTYGTDYAFGFYINGNNDKLIGYKINWKNVLTLLGEGIYQIKCEATTIFGSTTTQLSESYCLKQYTNDRANGTVRIEYYLNGVLGNNVFDEIIQDYGNLNWYNQHRFDGVFSYSKSAYKIEDVQYENGQVVNLINEENPEYLLKLKNIPTFKHNVLRTNILMADNTLITDYNNRNIDNYYKKKVKNIGGYDPNFYILKSKLAPVELTFKQEFNNLKKFRS